MRQAALQAYVARVGDRVKDASELSGRAVHLHAARQRRGQRLRAAGRLCLRHPRAAGAGQQRGRARRRARPRDRPRHRPPHRAALRPGAARPGRERWPASSRGLLLGGYLGGAGGCAARRPARRPGRRRWVPRPMSRATRASRSSRPTSWASAIWPPPATIPAPWRASSRRCRPTTPTGSGRPGRRRRRRRASSATGSAAIRARPSASPARSAADQRRRCPARATTDRDALLDRAWTA